MPAIVSGNTNATVIMIAEKVADLITGRVPAPAGNQARASDLQQPPRETQQVTAED